MEDILELRGCMIDTGKKIKMRLIKIEYSNPEISKFPLATIVDSDFECNIPGLEYNSKGESVLDALNRINKKLNDVTIIIKDFDGTKVTERVIKREKENLFPDPFNTPEMLMSDDKEIRRDQRIKLKEIYSDYLARHHDYFVERYNQQLGEARQLEYQRNRGIIKKGEGL